MLSRRGKGERPVLAGFTLYQLYWFFLIYSFLGWCAEVVFAAVTTGKLVNRGFLNGPVCPIYGFGMLAALVALAPVRQNLGLLFLGGMALASAIELAGGWALKKLFHTSWWDYSDQPFNLGGYICLSFSLLWGLAVVGVVRLVHPPIEAMVAAMPRPLGLSLGAVLGAVFLCDLAATVCTIAGLQRDLRELQRLAAALHRGSDLLTEQVGGAALAADEKLETGREKLAEGRQELAEIQAGTRAELEMRLDLLRARILDRRLGARRLLRAFPRMKSAHTGELIANLFADVKEKLKK